MLANKTKKTNTQTQLLTVINSELRSCREGAEAQSGASRVLPRVEGSDWPQRTPALVVIVVRFPRAGVA